MDVGGWLRSLGLECYEAAFRENAVHAGLLPDLTADDLKDLGITLVGHRRQLLDAIAVLRSGATAGDNSVPVSRSMPGDPFGSLGVAERRPLCVMFCDLVGSTALSARLDPEDLREVIRAYQARASATIQQFDGFVAQYVGDGLLVYFGWPHAHETDAARAVRAALAVVSALGETPVAGEALQARIGIATGLVVVGEPIGSGDSRQQTAIGETPNRAARLQSLAGPNQVVIDLATHRQIGGLFTYQDLGAFDLKGLPEPVPVWQVVAENRALGQFEALRSGLTPLIGRDEELGLLLRRWAQAKDGSGRVALISAEPGVGKSRLAEAVADRIATEPHTKLRYFCSPYHQDSALYPMIAQMERAAGFALGDTPDAKSAKLKALLAATEPSGEDVALLAELHGLPAGCPPPDPVPQRKKEKTFEVLLSQIERLARRKPVLAVFDDLQWIDPSSQEWLDRLIERLADWPVLLLALFRPEFLPPWIGQPQVTLLTLARLDRRDTAAMVASVAKVASPSGDPLAQEMVAEIAERTDGVPLFVEELTKAVLEAGAQTAEWAMLPGRWSVPATLHASLMARLDRLGAAAREVAQAGAAIGRAFDYTLLTSIIDLPEPQLNESLTRLTSAGLVFARGTPPEARYLFKHALVQDAAYGSLLRNRRQALHRRIAETLQQRFPEIAHAQPGILAQHCAIAGLVEQAGVYWLKAGQQALERFAMAEAVMQARKGLEVVAALPDSPRRREQEMDLLLTLGMALVMTKGRAATETVETLARVQALAEQLDRPEHLAMLLYGRCHAHFGRAEHRLVLSLAKQLEEIGKARNDIAAQSIGLVVQGISHLCLGELTLARALLEADADPAHAPFNSPYFSHAHLRALRLAHAGRALALLGYIDQARSQIDEAVLQARRIIRSAPTLSAVLLSACVVANEIGSPLKYAEELLALGTEQKSPWVGWGLAYRGRALVALGQAQEGFVLLTHGLAELSTVGTASGVPMLLTWLAEVSAMLGRPAEAWRYLTEAARIVEATDERVFEAEVLYRVPGDLLYAAGDQLGAEQRYRQAIAVAARQSAKLLQLRASVSFARLRRDQGRRAETRDLLAPVYGWFTEGFDAPLLKQAKALLDDVA